MAVDFLWHTTFGMIYFLVLASVCVYAILCGGKEYRLYSYCVLGAFLAARVLLATFDIREVITYPLTPAEQWMMAFGAVAEFAAIMVLVLLARVTFAAGLIGFAFLAKMICYVGLLCGSLSFDTMAAWTELLGYSQIVVIGTGCSFGGVRGKRSGYPDYRAGRAGIFSLTKSWLSPKRHI